MGRSRARVGRIIRGSLIGNLIAIRRFELLRIHLVSERDWRRRNEFQFRKLRG